MKKDSWFRVQMQNCYDQFKLSLWHKYYKKIANKAEFIFVSNCLHVNILKEYRTKIDTFGYGNTVEREENIIKMEY